MTIDHIGIVVDSLEDDVDHWERVRDYSTIAWGLPVVRETVRHVADAPVVDDQLVDLGADLRQIASGLVELLWSKPA